MLDDQDEIDEVPDAAVRGSFARTGIRVKLLRPVLFGRERRNRYGGNARETEPILSDNFIERFEDFIADAKVNVEFHKRPTVEARVNWEPSASLFWLIEFGHCLSDDKCEEVWQPHRGGQLKTLPEGRSRAFYRGCSFDSTSDSQVEVFRRSRFMEPQFQGVTALQNPALANWLRRIEHSCKESIKRDLPA